MWLLAFSLLIAGLAQRGPIPFDSGDNDEPTWREYRKLDGTGNSPIFEDFPAFDNTAAGGDNYTAVRMWAGQAGAPFIWNRIQPSFADGLNSVSTFKANPRTISTVLAEATTFGGPLVPNLINALHTEWGHFMTVDMVNTILTADPTGRGTPPLEPAHVPVLYTYSTPAGKNYVDWMVDQNGWTCPGVVGPCLAWERSAPFQGTGSRGGAANGNTPKRGYTDTTHFLDGSSIYGSSDDPARQKSLFNLGTGLMVVNAPWLFKPDYCFLGPPLVLVPPRNPGPGDPGQLPGCIIENEWRTFGDSRGNKHPALRMFAVLYQLEHNRLVTELRARNPRWSGYYLFQEARRFVIAHIQSTTAREYLGSTAGNPMPTYTGYNASVNPAVDVLFGAATLRYGHSAVRTEVSRLEADKITPCAGGSLAIRDLIFLPTRWQVVNRDENGKEFNTLDLACYARGFSHILSGKVDVGFVDDVRNFLVGLPRHGTDLFALNIYRGYDNGLPDYNTVREAYGLPRQTSFANITSDLLVQAALDYLYAGDLNAIDVYVGMLAEDHVLGGTVGPLLRETLMEQMVRTRDGDRFWFENPDYFTEDEIATVHGTKLKDLFARNFGMSEVEVPLSPFYVDKRQLTPTTLGSDSLFLFPQLQDNPNGLPWVTKLLAPFYELSWAIERHNGPRSIFFQIQTQSQGWVGLGFRPELNTMKGADIILCRAVSTALGAECRDSKALEVGEPALDSSILVGKRKRFGQEVEAKDPIMDDVTLHYFAQSNGFTTVMFSRLMDTGDIFDWPVGDNTPIIFAFNPETSDLRYHGPTRQSKVTINFETDYVGPPTRVYIPLGVTIWLFIMAGIGIVWALLLMLLIVVKYKYFHFQTPEFCLLICLGSIMGQIACILILVPEPTDGMCWAEKWLFGMSFWFVFTCLFAKVFRIWWTVQAAEKMKIQPVKVEMLLIPLLICCILEGVFQACWDGIYIVRPNVDIFVNTATNEYTLYCAGNMYMWLGSVLVRAMFLLLGVWLALETRKMQKSLNWSKEIALAMYTMAIFCFVLIPLGFAITNSPTLVIILKGIGYSMAYTIILFIVFFDTLSRIFRGKTPRALDSSAILSSNSGSMTGGSEVSVGIKSKSSTVS